MKAPLVRLRAMEPEDLDLLYKIENDSALWGIGTTNVPYSRYALHDYIAHSANDIYADKQVRFMVDNAQGQTVGIVDVVNFCPEHSRAELGIVILQAFRGQGYAASAISKAVEYARGVIHLHQLYAVIAQSNSHCLQIFRTLGFRECGTLSDWLCKGTTYESASIMQLFL